MFNFACTDKHYAVNSSSLSLHIKMGWLWSADPIRFKGTKLTNL